MTEVFDMLSRSTNGSVLAAAGCGKTEEIVKAVNVSDGRQLILTHTNAGVASLKARFRKLNVPLSKYKIDTIASWLLKYTAAYPQISGLVEMNPESQQWRQVYSASKNLFKHKFIREVIQSSYSGAFIDEYQDCTMTQHQIISQLLTMIPVRVLGDPLQGIFGFDDDKLVNWDVDVVPLFHPLPELRVPWRWENANKNLGKFLINLRKNLLDGDEIDLSSITEINWYELSVEKELEICYEALNKQGTVVGIHMWPKDAHASAKRLGGFYQSMEEMECKNLLRWVDTFEKEEGIALGFNVVNFLMECMSVDNYLDEIIKKLKKNDIDGLPSIAGKNELGYAFYRLVSNRDLLSIKNIIEIIQRTPKLKIHRRELLNEMKRSIQVYLTEEYSTLHEAAWSARYRTRIVGRKPERRTISRTLLIKGLEFNHAIILDGAKFKDMMNFYVAATRGSQSLTILSNDPIINYT